MKYVSRYNCSVCKSHLLFDEIKHTLTCKCMTIGCLFVNLTDYIAIPSSDLKK